VESGRAVPAQRQHGSLAKQFRLGTPRGGMVVTDRGPSLALGEVTGRMASGI
jgi:hypothetical protein